MHQRRNAEDHVRITGISVHNTGKTGGNITAQLNTS